MLWLSKPVDAQICNQLTVFVFVAELIKKRELEKDELRPLYMDFQATTPMVTVTNHAAIATGFISRCLC